MIMNRYNQTGGSDAFRRMFSCVGNGCGDVAVGAGMLVALMGAGVAAWVAGGGRRGLYKDKYIGRRGYYSVFSGT